MGKLLLNYPLVTTSPYGPRSSGFHGGIDLVGRHPNGYNVLDYICAKEKGTVVAVRKDCQGFEAGGSYGNYVKIDHGSGIETLYAHMAFGSVRVNVGDVVEEGTVIGYMGNTGTSYGGHLHFEVRENGVRIDPTEYAYGKPLPLNPTPVLVPVELKYKEGDKMVFTGILYADSKGNGAGQSRKDLVCTITKTYGYEGFSKPYNIDNGLGWVAEEDLTPYVEPVIPTPPVTEEINEGDTVIVNGFGTASSDGTGDRTANYVNTPMKVIGISQNASKPNRYALNQYNRGNVRDWSAVTGWFSIDSISK